MKSGIEYRRHRQCRTENFPRRVNAVYRRRIMQWRQVVQRFDAREHIIVDCHRRGEKISAVYHAVADGVDLPLAGATGRRQTKALDDRAHCDFVVRCGELFFRW